VSSETTRSNGESGGVGVAVVHLISVRAFRSNAKFKNVNKTNGYQGYQKAI